MPGELGDESYQQQAGYYEHRMEPDPEWSGKKDPPNWGVNPENEGQIDRILKRLRSKKYR
jgi:hypothetical protein